MQHVWSQVLVQRPACTWTLMHSCLSIGKVYHITYTEDPEHSITMLLAGSRPFVMPGGHALVLTPAPVPRPYSDCLLVQRDISVCGRNDGNSKARKKARRRQTRPKGKDYGGTGGDGGAGAWWEDDDLLPKQPSPQGRPAPAQPRYDSRPGRRRHEEEEDEEDGQGWWQKPEERSMQAYMPGQLSDWQVERLEQAYLVGRRKVKIQELAAELGLDRQEVIQWMKDFALKPQGERDAILKQREAELTQEHPRPIRQQPLAASARQGAAQQPSIGPSHGNAPAQQGFIPFYTRKEMGLTDVKSKRLPADVQRTLESVYQRTPYPSDAVIKGVWDLHKVNRETVLRWLDVRRQQDGMASNEQRRQASNPTLSMSPAKLREVMGAVAFDGNNLLTRMLGDNSPSPASADPAAAAAAADQKPKLVPVSSRVLAQLKSSLPSPAKYKGKTHAETMGIKQDARSLEVGGVRYEEVQRPAGAVGKWTAAWRHRRATTASKALPLLVKDESDDQEENA